MTDGTATGTAPRPAGTLVTSQRPRGDQELLDAAGRLSTGISQRSLEIEQARSVPADVVDALRADGLFRLAMPVTLGGVGAAPRTIVEIIEEISRADAATGWTTLIGNIGNAFLAWLDPDVARRILSAEPDILVAGGQAPLGRAERLPDGSAYRLSGRWPFGSGCLHSSWFMGGFIVVADGRPVLNAWGAPQMGVAYFPAHEAKIDDTWHVAGLSGTGSHDIVVDEISVPVEHTSVPYFERAPYPDPLYRLTAYNLLLTVMSGFPLGVARRALSEAETHLRDRVQISTGRPWIEDPAVQMTLLRHETALRAARRHLLDTLDQLLGELAEGEGDYAGRASLAAAVIHAFDTGREAVQALFGLAGTSAALDTSPLQRCLRDLVAGTQHVAFSFDSRRRIANAHLGLQKAPAFFGV